MAKTQQGRAILASIADPTLAVHIPRLIALSRSRSREGTFVRFAGDDHPTKWRGEGRDWTFMLTCRYASDEHALLVSLLSLVDEKVPAMPDSRLLLRTHLGLVPGLDPAVAVEVDGQVTDTPGEAGTWDVSVPVRVVQYDPTV